MSDIAERVLLVNDMCDPKSIKDSHTLELVSPSHNWSFDLCVSEDVPMTTLKKKDAVKTCACFCCGNRKNTFVSAQMDHMIMGCTSQVIFLSRLVNEMWTD